MGACPHFKGRFQFLIQRQHRRPEPPAQQGVGNALDTDTFLPIVQRKAVAAIVITALMHQSPRPAVLPVVHDGDFVTLPGCHSAHGSGTRAAALLQKPAPVALRLLALSLIHI